MAKGLRTRFCVSAAGLVFALASQAAEAQSETGEAGTPAAGEAIEGDAARTADANPFDIVVTARRRDERLQDVPAAITALSNEALQTQQIISAKDVQIVTPSLSVGGGNLVYSKNGGNYSIRGLGQGSFGGASVTSYFADAPFGPTGPAVPFFDIASVQVLKGPQGTLFGRATVGGAVLVTPNKAAFNDWSGMASVRVGNLGRFDLEGMLNVPVIDDVLAIRIAGNRTHLDGYTRVIQTGQRLDENNSQQFRIGVAFQPTDWFRNDFVYAYYNFRAASTARVLVGANPGLPALNRTAAGFAAICQQAVGFGYESSVTACQDRRVALSAAIRDALVAEVQRVRTGGSDAVRRIDADGLYPFVDRMRSHTIVNTSRVDMPEIGRLRLNVKNIFSAQWNRNVTSGDFDGAPLPVSASAFSTNAFSANAGGGSVAQWDNGSGISVSPGYYNRFYSNETQLNGNVDDDALIFILGYYAQRAPVTRNLAGSTNLNINFGGILTANMGPLSATSMGISGYDKETAVFGQATADLRVIGLEGVHLTGGYRHTRSDTLRFAAAGTIRHPGGQVVPGAISRAETSSSGEGWIMSADWRISTGLMVYATRRKGYKPGGVNTLVGAENIPGYVARYGPESVIDTEFGVKWDFRAGDVRGGVNAAVFQDDFKNIQRGFSAVTPAGSSAVFTANVAAARLRGLELEAYVQPVPALRIAGTYSYLDAGYTSWLGADPLNLAPPGTILDLSGSPFANAPKHKASATVSYTLPLDANGELRFSTTVYGQSRVFLNDQALRFVEVYGADLFDAVSEKGYTAVNARIDWSDVLGSGFDAALFARNLTNKTYAYSGGVQLHSVGIANKMYAEPRTYGIELTYHFGR